MQIEKLLEEQKKEFNQKFRMIEVVGDNEADGTFVIEHDKEKVWNWHKQSLKQFIDELIEREEKEIEKAGIVVRGAKTFSKVVPQAFILAKNDTLAHLKELKEQLG